MYSLVSAPVLGFDLTRLEGGSAAAAVLLRALTITESDITAAAATASGTGDRAGAWQDVESAAEQRRVLRGQTAALEAGAGELATALAVLERTPLGTVDGLLHCVRHDVLDWTWSKPTSQTEAAAYVSGVLSDAVAAAYLHELLPAETRHVLSAPWAAVVRTLPERPADLGPQRVAIGNLVDRVASLSGAEIARLGRAADRARSAIADWAPAVHSASWAVFLAGRVRSGASAQLLLVRAIDHAGIPVADRAGGVWNLLSGAVQALMVRDLLDSPTAARLLDPYHAALGPLLD
jgi:hypothetical protein